MMYDAHDACECRMMIDADSNFTTQDTKCCKIHKYRIQDKGHKKE